MGKDEAPGQPAMSGDPVKGRPGESAEGVRGEAGAPAREEVARPGVSGAKRPASGTGRPAGATDGDAAGAAADGQRTAGGSAEGAPSGAAGGAAAADLRAEAPESGVTAPEAAERIAELQAALAAERQESRQARARLQADFDNYRKRMLGEQARWRDDAQAELLLALLPIFDNLERAAKAAGDADAVRKGVELTLRQLTEVLERAGLKAFESLGQPFDPNRHEAMAQQPPDDNHKDGDVMVEHLRGYLWKGQVLRHALVVVAKSEATGEPGGLA